MSETPDSHNPYSPPQTEVSISHSSLQAMQKPKSIRWAMGVFVVKLVVINFIHWQLVQKEGLNVLKEMYREDPVSLIAPVTSLLALIGVILLGRSRIAYGFGSLALIVLCNDAVLITWREYASVFSNPDLRSPMLEAGILVIMVGMLLYLAYRFIFGLPSLQYYRITPESARE